MSAARVVSVPSYNLLLLNWYLLGVKMNLGHAHKTRFWYLLGLLSKFSDKHPRHFHRGEPPPLPREHFTILIKFDIFSFAIMAPKCAKKCAAHLLSKGYPTVNECFFQIFLNE